MTSAPKWFTPVAVAALLWNLLGCMAYLMDVMMSPEDIAKLTAAQQALHASRPAWSIGATALAVWGGALGSIGLLVRRRWATLLLALSLVGVIGQDVSLFGMSGAAEVDSTAIILQGLVFVVAVALLLLGRRAAREGWLR